MLSHRNPYKMPSSRRCWQRPCAGQVSSRLRRLLCVWRWEKWPTRCCYPASASDLRLWKNWGIDFFIRSCQEHSMLHCQEVKADAYLTTDKVTSTFITLPVTGSVAIVVSSV